MSMKIFARIMAGYVTPILMMLVIAVTTFIEIAQMERASSSVTADGFAAQVASQDIVTQLLNEQTGVRGFIISGIGGGAADTTLLEPYTAGAAAIPTVLTTLNQSAPHVPDLTALTATLSRQIASLQSYFVTQISLVR